MTDIKFPVSMPGPTEQLINPDGTATQAFQAFLESWVNANGGQGGTAIYDAAQLAAQSEQLALVQKQLRGTQQDVEALRAGVDQANARKIGRGDVFKSAILRQALADNAATRTVEGYTATHNVWPSGFGPSGSISNKGTNDAGTNWPSKTLEITTDESLIDVKAGSPVLVWISYKLTPSASAYEWMYFEHEVFRVASGSSVPNYGSATGRIDKEDLYDGVFSGNGHVSGNMGANAVRRTKPGMSGMILVDTPSSDGDYDYYFRWRVDDGYSFAVDGFEGPDASSGRTPQLTDVRIIATNLAR